MKAFVNAFVDFFLKMFRIGDNISLGRICHFRTYFGSTKSIYIKRHPWSRQRKGPVKKRKRKRNRVV